MRAASRAILVTLFGVLALLAVAPAAQALPAQSQVTVVLAQQPTTTAPPVDPQTTGDNQNRVTIGIIVVVLLGTVVIGRRIRKRAQKV